MKHFPIRECKALKTINHNRIKGQVAKLGNVCNMTGFKCFCVYICIYILFINHENINMAMEKPARDMNE